MTIETVLYDRLTTFAGLSALVGTRVYAHFRPQNDALPSLTYFRVSADRPGAMGADIGLVISRFQVDVYAASYNEASGQRPVAEQVRLALQRWTNTSGTVVQNTRFLNEGPETRDEETLTFRIALDFEIVYQE